MKINPKYKPEDAMQDRRAEKGIIWLFCFVSVFGSILVVYVSKKRQLPSDNNDSTMSFITSSGVLLTIGWINSIVGCLMVIYYNYISTPPSTNPVAFRKFWIKNCTQQQQPEQLLNHPNRPPILVCFGDVLVRGSYSSNFVNHIPILLSQMKYGSSNDTTKIGKEQKYNTFKIDDPIWVINAAENGYTSHVLVQEERIQKTYHAMFNMDQNDITNKNKLPSHPNYVLLLTGTNDALCMTSSFIRDALETLHKPTGTILNIGNCTASTFQSNIYSLIRTIRSFPYDDDNNMTMSSSQPRSAAAAKQNNSTITEICICTIPPIGEEHTNINKQSRMVTSLYNQNVEKLNKVIEAVVTCDEFVNDGHITIIPFHKECMKAIDTFQKQKQQKQQASTVKQGNKKLPEPDLVLCHLINMVYYASLGSIQLTSTWLSGNENAILLKDNMHLNENGRDIITQLVSDWIVRKENDTTKKNK